MSMTPDMNYFKDHPNGVFVETGSYIGDSIDLALQAGFTDIRAIEIDPKCVDHCRERFSHNPVIMFQGDSAEILWDVIKGINEPITFWLDSHWMMIEGTEPGKNPWPLFEELQHIKRHPIKNHTIIIDDMWYLTHPHITGWQKPIIETWLYDINPAYQIRYKPNPIINNILIATV
jgi:hypothetical protein